jgi:hypothetical protein
VPEDSCFQNYADIHLLLHLRSKFWKDSYKKEKAARLPARLKCQTITNPLIKELGLNAAFRKPVDRIVSDPFELVFKVELIPLLETNSKEPQIRN